MGCLYLGVFFRWFLDTPCVYLPCCYSFKKKTPENVVKQLTEPKGMRKYVLHPDEAGSLSKTATENSTSSCSGHGCPALAGLATVNCPRLDARKLKRCARKCLSLQKTQSSNTLFLQPFASPPSQPQSWARSRYKLCSSCLTRCCPPLWWS